MPFIWQVVVGWDSVSIKNVGFTRGMALVQDHFFLCFGPNVNPCTVNVLLTGATGYIGKRLLHVLLEQGHTVYACVRDRQRWSMEHPGLVVLEVDFLDPETLDQLPAGLDGAYYLIHSMSDTTGDFAALEERQAENFKEAVSRTRCQHVVYLSGIINDQSLSRHLSSRKRVEEVLKQGSYHLTTLRAGIILGSGSASFEIMRDLVEKLPVMITPRWLHTRSQPIAIRNVIEFLSRTLFHENSYDQSFDIAGPEVLTYKQMLLKFARLRGMNRLILTVPVLTPRLSSYWLFFVTSTSYSLAVNLVNSMKVEVIAKPNGLARDLEIELLTFAQAIERAFQKVDQDDVTSSWKDPVVVGRVDGPLHRFLQVPIHGCFVDRRVEPTQDPEASLKRIWSIGGKNGWYQGDFLWKLRGLLDRFAGGVGLRRGRTRSDDLQSGDVLDFWRVVLADRKNGRLLLYAEMRLPGEAWLEFRLDGEKRELIQTATFRPRGVSGRLYWYTVFPFHGFIFRGLAKKIAAGG